MSEQNETEHETEQKEGIGFEQLVLDAEYIDGVSDNPESYTEDYLETDTSGDATGYAPVGKGKKSKYLKVAAVAVVAVLVASATIIHFGIDLDSDKGDRKASVPVWKDGYTWHYMVTDEDDDGDVDRIEETRYVKEKGESVGSIQCYGLYRIHFMEGVGYDRPYFRPYPSPIAKTNITEVDDDDGVAEWNDFMWPLEEGKRWNNSGSDHDYYEGNYTVSYVKNLETPAGKFDCFMIHARLIDSYEPDDYYDRTFWYSEKVKNVVKYRIEDKWGSDIDTLTGELMLYDFKDSDGDLLANDFEEDLLGSNPDKPDTDGDEIKDSQDISVNGNFYFLLNLTDFQTSDNDEYDNGNNPSECDPYFIVIFEDFFGDEIMREETEHLTDQNTIDFFQMAIDIPDDAQNDFFHLGPIIKICAWDDDSQDGTDTNGDDEVDIDDDSDGYESLLYSWYPGKLLYHQQYGEFNEGETISVSGSGTYGANGHICGGSVDICVTLMNEEDIFFEE